MTVSAEPDVDSRARPPDQGARDAGAARLVPVPGQRAAAAGAAPHQRPWHDAFMQFSQNFATTCAVTIPVLSLAAAVNIREARERPVRRTGRREYAGRWTRARAAGVHLAEEVRWARTTAAGWFCLQLSSVTAEMLCLWALASPGEFEPSSDLGLTALWFVLVVIAVQMLLLVVRPAGVTDASDRPGPRNS